MNYLYNDVKLPPLPEYDKKAYPYVTIDIVNSTTCLNLYAVLPTMNGNQYVFAEKCAVIYYTLHGNTWEYFASLTISNASFDTLIWSNHDILKEDGTTYLAATCPIDAEIGEKIHDYCLHSITDPINLAVSLQGWLIGRRLAEMRGKKPVAYLYNGVRLPKLPEWDKEKYPYAYITIAMSYYLLVSTKPLKASGGSIYSANLYTIEESTILGWDVFSSGYEWEESSFVSGNNKLEMEANSKVISGTIKWANTAVYLNDTTTLVLPASEPVPVYE